MKIYYQKSESDRAVCGIEAVQMSDEHYEQLKDKVEFLTVDSSEVQAYLAAQAQRGAAKHLDGLMAAVQGHIDAPAKSLGYDNMISMSSYFNSGEAKFAADAKAGIKFRDACWRAAFTAQQAVQAGGREIPTADELVAELPQWSGA